MSTVIVGTVAFDKIETPFGKTDKILGGAATFISLTASQFADDVHIISVVGGDFPDEYIKLFSDRNINTEGLQVKPEGKSFYWSGRYHTDMNTRDTLVTELNVLADFDPILPETYRDGHYELLDGFGLGRFDEGNSKSGCAYGKRFGSAATYRRILVG